MKKVYAILFFTLALLVSVCLFAQKPNPSDSLPPPAKTFLTKHFNNRKIYRVKYNQKNGEWEVQLINGIEIEFDYNGHWFGIDGEMQPLPKSIIDMLPEKITTYIAKNYPRRAIIKIEREPYGYEIELSNSVELLFDHKGRFLKKD